MIDTVAAIKRAEYIAAWLDHPDYGWGPSWRTGEPNADVIVVPKPLYEVAVSDVDTPWMIRKSLGAEQVPLLAGELEIDGELCIREEWK